ncbi:MAG: arginine deiminase-related protein [Lysobacterales bacterium]
MLVTDPVAFLAEFSLDRYPQRDVATARAAFLVGPASDTLAAESAIDNRYMDLARMPDASRALRQHAELARRLGADLPVLTFPGDPDCPDGMFPNNVFATVPGCLIIGHMRHPVRQREASRTDIRGFFGAVLGYRTHDLSRGDFVAELTGALCIDRARGIGYCGLSERCDMAGARAMHEAFGLRLTFCFDLAPGEYHTNVVLAILAGRAAVLAPDGFADPAVPAAIAQAYAARAIALSPAQKRAFAGNAIALAPNRAWLSATGAAALEPAQLATLERAGFALGDVDLEEIEKAGGSLRCCVAEIF